MGAKSSPFGRNYDCLIDNTPLGVFGGNDPVVFLPLTPKETKMTKAEKEAAKAAKQAEKEAAKNEDGIIVRDPQVLRPTELPLVVEPEDGEWANPEQAEYAKVLNAYAYKNPKKWVVKKAVLLAQLRELGSNPSKIEQLRGVRGSISYKNKLMQE